MQIACSTVLQSYVKNQRRLKRKSSKEKHTTLTLASVTVGPRLKYPPVEFSFSLDRPVMWSVISFWKIGQNCIRRPNNQLSKGPHPRNWTSPSVLSTIRIIVSKGMTKGGNSRIEVANVCIVISTSIAIGRESHLTVLKCRLKYLLPGCSKSSLIFLR